MKKLIAISVVLALVTGAAFAQIAGGMYVNAWGTGTFVPLILQTAPKGYDGKTVQDEDGVELGMRSFVGVGPEWGGKAIETGFNVGGWSENIGFGISMGGFGDNFWSSGNIWARPFGNDYLKLTIGDYTDDTLRGKVGVTSAIGGFVMMSYPGGEDSIFNRIGTDTDDGCDVYYSGQGFMFTSMPVDGLIIMLNVNTEGNLWSPADWAWNEAWAKKVRTNDAYRAMQVAVGYNIAGIGLARVQYIGGWAGTLDPDVDKDGKPNADKIKLDRADFSPTQQQAAIQAAFNLTAVDGLNLDIGAKYFLPVTYKDDWTGTNGMTIGLGANYSMDALNINFHSVANLGAYKREINKDKLEEMDLKEDKSSGGLDFGVFLTPSYELDFAKVGFDFAFRMGGLGVKDAKGDTVEYTSWNQMGFGLWLQKGLGSGDIKAGVSFTTPVSYDKADSKDKSSGSSLIQIPITLTYAFF